jgi:DNA polymerase-3 subunit delta
MNLEPSLKSVLADIRKGKVAPCYLLHGDEDYLVGTALQEIVDALIPEADRGMNLSYLDGEKEDAISLCRALLTPPLIPGRKAVVVKNSRLLSSRQSLPDMVRKIKETLESDPARAVGIFTAFVRTAGWDIDDLRGENWRYIPAEEWRRLTGEEADEREKWLPALVEMCSQSGVSAEPETGGEEEINRVLQEGLPDGNCLVITAEVVDRRKKLFKTVSEKGVVLNFQQAKGRAGQKSRLFEETKEFLRQRGVDIEPRALNTLATKTGADLRTTMAELEKLIAYGEGKPSITERDVEEAVEKSGEASLFVVTASLVEKNLSGAVSAVRELLGQGIHPLAIVAMVVREYRLLLHAKALVMSGKIQGFDRGTDYGRFQKVVQPLLKELSSAGGEGGPLELLLQHPYVVYNALRSSGNYSLDELVGILDCLTDVDLALKSSGQDPQLILERLAVRICNPSLSPAPRPSPRL